MEEDKKKKKNKKKKNKQNKAAENSVDNAGEHIPVSQNHVHQTGQRTAGQDHEITDAQNVANDPEVSTLAETEKHHWLEREASLEEKIKLLKEERDARIQKEVFLEEKIRQLLEEKNFSLTKEGNLLEQIKQLEGEKVAYSQKEAILEHQISQLEKEKDAYMQKEASLEGKIVLLQMEQEAYMQKEIKFEEKINHLVDEAAMLSLEKVSLEEKAKQMERQIDSCVQKENSNKEIVASLNMDNSRLQAQLEQSRNSLLEENQHLRETIFDLQSQILNFEGNAALCHSSAERKMQTIENGDVASQIEAAHVPVEKLITENAELVEEVNELYVELNRRSLQKEMSSDNGTPGTAESAVVGDNSADILDLKVAGVERQNFASAGLMHETGAEMLMSGENEQPGKDINKDERNDEHVGATSTAVFSNSPEPIDSDEIVQIPLEAANKADSIEVPISDAPFIGAPFRIISFVARYVSGADLVEKNSSTAGR